MVFTFVELVCRLDVNVPFGKMNEMSGIGKYEPLEKDKRRPPLNSFLLNPSPGMARCPSLEDMAVDLKTPDANSSHNIEQQEQAKHRGPGNIDVMMKLVTTGPPTKAKILPHNLLEKVTETVKKSYYDGSRSDTKTVKSHTVVETKGKDKGKIQTFDEKMPVHNANRCKAEEEEEATTEKGKTEKIKCTVDNFPERFEERRQQTKVLRDGSISCDQLEGTATDDTSGSEKEDVKAEKIRDKWRKTTGSTTRRKKEQVKDEETTGVYEAEGHMSEGTTVLLKKEGTLDRAEETTALQETEEGLHDETSLKNEGRGDRGKRDQRLV